MPIVGGIAGNFRVYQAPGLVMFDSDQDCWRWRRRFNRMTIGAGMKPRDLAVTMNEWRERYAAK